MSSESIPHDNIKDETAAEEEDNTAFVDASPHAGGTAELHIPPASRERSCVCRLIPLI